MLRVSLLGDFKIQYGDATIKTVLTPRLQSLLAYLLLHHGISQTRSHLAFLFWPNTSEAQARTNLRNLLHQLRSTLPFIDDHLIINGQSLLWRTSSQFILDVNQFQEKSAGIERGTREDLQELFDLYKGDLLPGCYEDWIMPFREELRYVYIKALETLLKQ